MNLNGHPLHGLLISPVGLRPTGPGITQPRANFFTNSLCCPILFDINITTWVSLGSQLTYFASKVQDSHF